MRSIFKKWILGFLTIMAVIPGICDAQKQDQPVSIIFDSDMGPDYDDVGAIAVLHALADSGEANILATIGSNRYPQIASVFDALNTYFGRPDIPIGVPKGASVEMRDWQGWSDVVIDKYPHNISSNKKVSSSVKIYRKVLSNQPDNSVTIVTVGFLTNLADLLESGPDEFSEKDGRQLVETKVNRLVSMAGWFPSGKEFNVMKDIPAADYVFEEWPTEIIFSGFKIGNKIKTGIPLISKSSITKNPVKDAYSISIPQSDEDKNGRSSWDQTVVLVAVRGADSYYHLVPGKISVDAEGKTSWDNSKTGHYRLVEKKSVDEMQKLINTLMQHQPN